jgi:hypothetical protein
VPLDAEEVTEAAPIEEEITSAQPQAEHRIGVRQVGGVGEFYDKQTGETFIPRGANYAFVPAGGSYTNLLLRVNTYDPQRTRDDFSRLAGLGYNTDARFSRSLQPRTGLYRQHGFRWIESRLFG